MNSRTVYVFLPSFVFSYTMIIIGRAIRLIVDHMES